MFCFLRIVRGICGVVFCFQLVGLIPALTWVENPSALASESKFVFFLILKIIFALVFGAIFFGMRSLINHMHIKKYGIPHPTLAKKALAL